MNISTLLWHSILYFSNTKQQLLHNIEHLPNGFIIGGIVPAPGVAVVELEAPAVVVELVAGLGVCVLLFEDVPAVVGVVVAAPVVDAVVLELVEGTPDECLTPCVICNTCHKTLTGKIIANI